MQKNHINNKIIAVLLVIVCCASCLVAVLYGVIAGDNKGNSGATPTSTPTASDWTDSNGDAHFMNTNIKITIDQDGIVDYYYNEQCNKDDFLLYMYNTQAFDELYSSFVQVETKNLMDYYGDYEHINFSFVKNIDGFKLYKVCLYDDDNNIKEVLAYMFDMGIADGGADGNQYYIGLAFYPSKPITEYDDEDIVSYFMEKCLTDE